MSDDPKLGFLARVSTLGRLRGLTPRITKVRKQINDLQDEVRRQTDKFVPSMNAIFGQLCRSVEENTLVDVYTEIWGGPGRVDLAGGAQHTLVFPGFCASAKSTHASRYGQGQLLTADDLASVQRSRTAPASCTSQRTGARSSLGRTRT